VSQRDVSGLPWDLKESEVRVWIAQTDLPEKSIERLRRLLDRQERARASRFRFDRDRNAFVAARGALRTLLGRYLGERPERVRFEYGPYGKPTLASEWSTHRLHFNLSHTDTIALFAFSVSAELGIDVERVRPLADIEDVAKRFFSKAEIAALSRVPARSRERAFFAFWTAKEAYIKGIGHGLSMPLDRFAVSLSPSEGPIRLRVLDADAAAPLWRIHRFEPSPSFVAAVAVRASRFRLERSWLPLKEMTG
jgi:4'-phosphopantetheinyl transferase